MDFAIAKQDAKKAGRCISDFFCFETCPILGFRQSYPLDIQPTVESRWHIHAMFEKPRRLVMECWNRPPLARLNSLLAGARVFLG